MNLASKILLLALGLFSFGFSQSENFDAANKAYEEEDYLGAIQQYQDLLDAGYQSLNLYYNLGNAYYKNNEIAKSILFFEKALKLDPSNANVAHNLKLAYLSTNDKIEPLPQLFLVKWWLSLITHKSASKWAKYGVVFLWLAFGMFALSFFLKKKRVKFFGVLFVIFALGFLFLALSKNNFDKNHNYAIVMDTNIYLKSAPNSTGKDLYLVHEGLKLQIIDAVDTWTQIRMDDGNEAWVESKYLEQI